MWHKVSIRYVYQHKEVLTEDCLNVWMSKDAHLGGEDCIAIFLKAITKRHYNASKVVIIDYAYGQGL